MLDEQKVIADLLNKTFDDETIHYLFGDELGYDFLEPCGMVFTRFNAGPDRSGSLGVIGPSRLNYSTIVPLVKYFGQLVTELAKA